MPHRPPSNFYSFVSGEDVARRSAAARMAWEIENEVIALGWPAGRIIGSERLLTARFGVSRETLREAIRIVERRGSMRMIRGRFGGLGVAQPSLQRTAIALATYLRAIDCTSGHAVEMIWAFVPMMIQAAISRHGASEGRAANESHRLWLARLSGDPALLLCAATLDVLHGVPAEPSGDTADVEQAVLSAVAIGNVEAAMLAVAQLPLGAPSPAVGQRSSFDDGPARGARIARGLFERALDLTMKGNRLGSEWELASRFASSRAVIRQSLRILADLDMLESRRGRRGGVFIKRPSPAGVVRQVFPYLAAAGVTPRALVWLVWEINVAQLKIAAIRLTGMAVAERERFCSRLARLLDSSEEPERWVLLQQALAEVGRNPVIDTFTRCLVTYQARLASPPPFSADTSRALITFEREIVESLLACDGAAAECSHRAAQQLMSELIAGKAE